MTETTAAETTAADETAAAGETGASSEDSGLLTDKLPNGDPIYLVDMMEYLTAHPEIAPIKAECLNVDYYGKGDDTSMATFFFNNPIKNSTYLMLPMIFSFDGTKDPNTIEWGSYFLIGDQETCIKEDHGLYLEPDPEYLLKGADTFQLIDNSIGFFQMAMSDPFDVCAITALPDVAPDGWDPFDVGIETTVMLVGFPTEADRQVFLDSPAK